MDAVERKVANPKNNVVCFRAKSKISLTILLILSFEFNTFIQRSFWQFLVYINANKRDIFIGELLL